MNRRLVKTLTWAVLAFSITTVTGWIVTGSFIKGLGIGGICRVIKLPAYYIHDLLYDRAWKTDTIELKTNFAKAA